MTGMDGDSADRRRAAIEAIIRASADWGWEMAQLGYGRPEPIITWNDGIPKIAYAPARPPLPSRPRGRWFRRTGY